MELNYDPLWDESGELRRGCTSSEEIPLCSVPAVREDSARSIPSSSPHKICGFCGDPISAVADRTIFHVCDGYYHQLNFSV